MYVEPGVRPEWVNVVPAWSPTREPLTYTVYPATPTLSLDADQEKLICVGEVADPHTLGGIEGTVLSPLLLLLPPLLLPPLPLPPPPPKLALPPALLGFVFRTIAA